MPKFIINGPASLNGEISVKGAKNLALKAIPAAILSKQTCSLSNLPQIEDVDKSLSLFESLGGSVKRENDKAEITALEKMKTELDPKFANKFRASIMFTGPLLARFGEVKFPHPGGCVIGAGERPIDLFLEGFQALGAKMEIDGDFYKITAGKSRNGIFFFPIVSVTATECLMLYSTIGEGTAILRNCAMEPEITALAEYLNSHGAKIEGAGTPIIKIDAVPEISAGDFKIIPDRIETGSFAILAGATKSELTIKNCKPEHIRILLEIFKRIGIEFEEGPDWLIIKPKKEFSAYGIKTHEYPGFPTDLQSPYTVLMTQAKGTSLIHETIYDRRLLYTDSLSQMGADIVMCDPHRVVINGPTKLWGKKLTSPDLRAGIAMIIAALAAEGKTEIDNIYQIDRGYEKIEERLKNIGANIRREE